MLHGRTQVNIALRRKSQCNMQKQIGWKSAADGMISVTMMRQPTSRISKAHSKEGNSSVSR